MRAKNRYLYLSEAEWRDIAPGSTLIHDKETTHRSLVM